MTEWRIGEIREVNGEWYQCVEQVGCHGCAFSGGIVCTFKGTIRCFIRSDGKPVSFKKLEKIGEPYSYNGIIVQKYKIENTSITISSNRFIYLNGPENTIEIEIKQTKEDMREKKTDFIEELNALCKRYNMSDGVRTDFISEVKEIIKDTNKETNLKPFNLEAAKAGKPVCTRGGRKARIICFDIKDKDNPIAAAVYVGECESVYLFTNKGEYNKGREDELDLMMLPEKKEGWAVIRKSDIYETEEQAKEVLLNSRVGVMIRKINWEE